MAKSNFRDKRYVLPTLLVDLLTGVHETRLWSATQLILRDVAGDLKPDALFSGAFSFGDDPACGLFQTVIKSNAN